MAVNSILQNHNYGTFTMSSGTASVTIESSFGILSKIWIKPTTSSTVYDFKLTDFHSEDVFVEQDIAGTYSESDVGEPIYGNFTFTVENATNDEEFTYLLVIRTS